jgi:maleate isomerase
VPDVLGYRAKIGLLVPSTNAVVEPELHAIVNAGVPGVTLHTGRIAVFDQDLRDAAAEERFRQNTLAVLADAVRLLMTCAPDYIAMGLSAPTFWGGIAGAAAFRQQLETLAGVPVSTAAEALARALALYPGVSRVATLSPYKSANETQLHGFLGESGYQVVSAHSLLSPSALAIADADESAVLAAIDDLERARPEAIIQAGTNLPMARLADTLEQELGKPVLAVNTVILWDALRRQGCAERVPGFGSLMRDH